MKDGYKLCEVCGKLIKIKGANSKYCEKCAGEIESKNNIKRIKKCREAKK